MVNIGLRWNRPLRSRDARGSVKDLLKVHPAFESREGKLSRAELIKGTPKFAAGTTPQANSDVAESFEAG